MFLQTLKNWQTDPDHAASKCTASKRIIHIFNNTTIDFYITSSDGHKHLSRKDYSADPKKSAISE